VSVGFVPRVVVGGRARTSPTLAVKDASHRCAVGFADPWLRASVGPVAARFNGEGSAHAAACAAANSGRWVVARSAASEGATGHRWSGPAPPAGGEPGSLWHCGTDPHAPPARCVPATPRRGRWARVASVRRNRPSRTARPACCPRRHARRHARRHSRRAPRMTTKPPERGYHARPPHPPSRHARPAPRS